MSRRQLSSRRRCRRTAALACAIALGVAAASARAAAGDDADEHLGAVAGVVVDESGESVSGVPLAVVRAVGLELALLERMVPSSDVVTGSDGAFRVECLGAGTYGLRAAFDPVTNEAALYRIVGIELRDPVVPEVPLVTVGAKRDSEGLVVTVTRVARVMGSIESVDGSPASAALVRLYVDSGSSGDAIAVRGFRRTDDNGHYAFLVQRPGTYRVSALYRGETAESDAIRIPDGAQVRGVDLVVGHMDHTVAEPDQRVLDDEDPVRLDIQPPEPFVRVPYSGVVARLDSEDPRRKAALRVNVVLVYPPETEEDEELWARLHGEQTLEAIESGLGELPSVESLVSDPTVIEVVANAIEAGIREAGLPAPVAVRVVSFVIQG